MEVQLLDMRSKGFDRDHNTLGAKRDAPSVNEPVLRFARTSVVNSGSTRPSFGRRVAIRFRRSG